MKKPTPIQPPKMADRFFNWYCCDRLKESIQGDLHERFWDRYEDRGPLMSRLDYWISVIRFINRFTLSRKNETSHYNSNNLAMIRNYLLITFRSLMKNKGYAAINIFGLAFGLASCLIIFFFVRMELSVDKFHEKHDRIFRITNTFERSSGTIFWARTPPALAPAIKSNISSVQKVTRLRYADDHIYTYGDKIFSQGNVFYADSAFLQIFDFKLKSGSRKTALKDPNSIVLTEAMAARFFGNDDPMGKLINFDNQLPLQVTGILEDLPVNTHITFDMLISFNTFRVPDGYLADLNSWSWAGFHTYALLSDNADLAATNDQILKLYKEHFNSANIDAKTEMQSLLSIYLDSEKYTNIGESIRTGNKTTIYGLSVVALLILVMAGFNFMNLSTALSLGRGKEIGIRKTMGAAKGRIIAQFLVESQVVSFLSLFVALILTVITQSYFETQLGVVLPPLSEYLFLLPLFFLATMFFGLLAGSYPSFILSSFSPIAALTGNLKAGKSGAIFRNSLMVFQFIISVLLIAGSMVIVSQINFIKNKNLGFEQENILQIKVLREDMAKHYHTLKNKFQQHAQVLNVAMSSHSFDGGSSSGPANFPGAPDDESYQLAYYQTDYDFLKLTNIDLLEGRFFSRDFPSDSTGMVLNETAVATLGLTDPIGTKINFTRAQRSVIGVVKDFHFNSLHTDIAPMAIIMPFTNTELILVKVAPGNISELLTSLENDWNTVVGSAPFDVTFLNDGIQQMYDQEQKLASLINSFSGLAVVLACMGLYGLVAFSVQSRLKEVGIRKVLGAAVFEILLVLSRKFILLIAIANLIAWPLIYYIANWWLDNFAYRIDLPWWLYVGSGIVLLLIAMATISQQTIQAANTNPVKVLRNE